MNILLLEDIEDYAKIIIESLEYKLPGVKIVHVVTEFEFRERLPELLRYSFDVGIFDVMVNWCRIKADGELENDNPPPEVRAELEQNVKWRSGVRCRRLFTEALAQAGRRDVPCLYYTILEEGDMAEVRYDDLTPIIAKTGDMLPLVNGILQVIAARPRA